MCEQNVSAKFTFNGNVISNQILGSYQGCGIGSRSHKELEVCGWSQIPNNTGSGSRIFLSNSDCPIGSFFTSHS